MTQPGGPGFPACWSWPVTPQVRQQVAEADLAKNEEVRISALGRVLAGWQEGRCAVCGGGGGYPLVHDHDHDTGYLRGLLCIGCNSSEGHQNRSPEFERYRDRPPAVMLGFRWFYAYPDSREFLMSTLGPDPVEVLAAWQRKTDPHRRGRD